MILAPAFLLLAFTAPSTGAVCPTSDVHLLDPTTLVIEAASYDTTLTENGWLTAHAAYDAEAGTVGVIHGALYPGQTSVTVRDEFDLVGAQPGTQIVVNLVLDVVGSIVTSGCGGSGCGGSVYGSIAANGKIAEESAGGIMFAPETRPVHLTVQMDVPITAGTPLPIEFRVSGSRGPGGNHRAEGMGTYRFIDVPPGLSIVSCRGFAGVPTPARPSSWGGVKAAYR